MKTIFFARSRVIRITALLLGSVTLFFFQNCSSGFKFQAEPMMNAGNSSLSAPQIVFTDSADVMNTSDISVGFNVTGSASSVTCQLNNNQAQSCAAPSVSYNNLPDGDYTLSVSAVSASGFVTTGKRIFRKDATPPAVMVSSTPAALSNQTSATFVFVVTDNLSGVASQECSLDNAAFATCVSPAVLTGLAMGVHNFRIRAKDRAGNSSALYTYNWSLDLSNPTVLLSSQPASVTNQVNASFSFSGSGVISYECSLDDGAYTSCTSPKAYSALASTAHTFRVRGANSIGTVSAATTYSWVIDAQAPSAPALTSNVTNPTTAVNASFNFSSVDSGSGIAGYRCSLDNAAYAVCASPLAYSHLTLGSHSLKVKALDMAGNESTVSTFSWLINAAVSNVKLAWDPNSETTLAGYKIYYGTSSKNYTASLDVGLVAPSAGAVASQVNNLTVGQTYYFVVVAYDANKVESPVSNEVSKLVQ